MRSMKGYADRLKRRVWVLWAAFAVMLVYMVVVGELGLGDSRYQTHLAEAVSRIIFFGGMIWILYKIRYNHKLLKNSLALKQEAVREMDERRQWLYDKSGGIVFDILLYILLIFTCTAALSNMDAFGLSAAILGLAILVKGCVYIYYDRFYRGG